MHRRGGVIRWVATFGLLALCACGADEASDGDGQEVTTVGLDGALAAVAEADSYIVRQYTGQRLVAPFLGADSDVPIDEDEPTMVGEVTPELSHQRFDLSKVFGPMFGDSLPSIGFDMWVGADRVVIDSRDYTAIQEINPSADLGPFAPGVSFIDIATLQDDAPGLVAAVAGQGMVDLGVMAERLPDVMTDVEENGNEITGTAAYADLVEAVGTDIETIARSTAGGVALNLDVDPDLLTDFYVDFYEATDADVTLELGPDGSARSLRYTVDLSDIYLSMLDEGDPLGLDVPAAEIDEARELFAETEWILDLLLEFEVVEDLEVDPAPVTTDDRTEEWLEFFENAGF